MTITQGGLEESLRVQPAVVRLEGEFYQIDKPRILAATTPEYRKFLRESGYGDLDSCSGIGFAKSVLKYDQSVRDAARRVKLSHTGSDGDYVVSINHPDARKLVEALGYKVPTVGLMYRLFIPYIKELTRQGNTEAEETLYEMVSTKAEWLEDLILNKTRLTIGTQERKITLPDKDGRFDSTDISEFGYPNAVRDTGKFYHWHISRNKSAAFRIRGSELNLHLDRGPSMEGSWFGVRLTKLF
jgi:hypothetical protein